LKLTNSKSRILFNLLPKDDPKQRCPDITLARERLKWEPSVDVTEGLKETIRYFKKMIGK
jgi:nucleoside-diphosphate-sugar epimerase